MNKKNGLWIIGLTLLFAVLLSGCGNPKGTDHHIAADANMLEPIKVELRVNPAEVTAGKPVRFEAKVTHQGQNVDDAKEVMFEYWKDGSPEDEHSKEVVAGSGDGLYVLEKTFEEPGTYHVISHVTARDQHSMPSEGFTIK
ncbi:FixH family protein [Paenibacillus sp. A14]|uniref:FixH family protein n=1 Tax=Paenibacillus sp. A14 TaxID=3119820 RepID=UPI002FE14794